MIDGDAVVRAIVTRGAEAESEWFVPLGNETASACYQSQAFLDRRADIVACLPAFDRAVSEGMVPNARVIMARAWVQLLAMTIDDAAATILEVEACLRNVDPQDGVELAAEFAVLQGVLLVLRDDYYAALPIGLAALSQGATALVSFVAGMLCRLAFWKMGDFSRFHASRQALWDQQGRRDTCLFAFDRAVEAAVEVQHLRFGLAGKLARQALKLATRKGGRASSSVLLPAALLAQLRYEEGDLAEAEELLRDLLPLVRTHGSIESAIRIYPLLARIAAHRSQGDFAMLLLREGELLGERRGWSRLAAECSRERVDLYVRSGRIDDAARCLERMRAIPLAATASDYARRAIQGCLALASARIVLARQPCVQIVARLRDLHRDATARGDLYLALFLAIRLAEASRAVGEEDEAVEILIRSLEIGASVGLHQLFLDGGKPIADLLVLAFERLAGEKRDRRHLLPYVATLLDGGGAASQGIGLSRSTKVAGCLSSRECGILELIRRGNSNKRIAQSLGIAPETVKSHVKNIFLKLGVQSRVEAVSRAHSLGFI